MNKMAMKNSLKVIRKVMMIVETIYLEKKIKMTDLFMIIKLKKNQQKLSKIIMQISNNSQHNMQMTEEIRIINNSEIKDRSSSNIKINKLKEKIIKISNNCKNLILMIIVIK